MAALVRCTKLDNEDYFGPFGDRAKATEWLKTHSCTRDTPVHEVLPLRVSAPGHNRVTVNAFNRMKGEPGYGQEPEVPELEPDY
jgi:hypothetical protein